MGVPPSAMFQGPSNIFGVCDVFFENDCSWDAGEVAVLKNEAIAHGCVLRSYRSTGGSDVKEVFWALELWGTTRVFDFL